LTGLKSKLQHIKIEDYHSDELKLIWVKELQDRGFKCEDKVTSAIMSKLRKNKNPQLVCVEVSTIPENL
jgi:hypothetical protein